MNINYYVIPENSKHFFGWWQGGEIQKERNARFRHAKHDGIPWSSHMKVVRGRLGFDVVLKLEVHAERYNEAR